MKVLVVGGAGYIGAHMVRWLVDHAITVEVLDNLSTGHRAAIPDGIHLHQVDLRERQATESALQAIRPDVVFHFAAKALVGESVSRPIEYYENNFVGTLNLLLAMRAAACRRIVFSSTCAVYGIPKTENLDEQHPREPINPYGASKLACEDLLRDCAAAGDVSAVALRYFNAAGAHPSGTIGEAHEPETHLIPNAIRAALGQLPTLAIHGTDYPTPDGTCIRDYIHVEDLASAHALAMRWLEKNEGWQAINLGTELGSSVFQVLALVEELSGKVVPCQRTVRRPGDPPRLVASAVLARKCLGWRPRHDLRSILESAWRWHRSPRY